MIDTDLLIVFSDGSKRARGFHECVSNSEYSIVFNLNKDDEIQSNFDERINCENMRRVEMVSKVINTIEEHDGEISIDISVLSRFEFLFLLRMAEEIGRYSDLRILYSEPKNYTTENNGEYPIGIEKISSIPGFVNEAPLNRKVVLVLLLGFEPARTLAIYDRIDPDETYAIIPDPPYHPEWRGRSERLNSNIINTIKSDNIYRMSSSDPEEFEKKFKSFAESVNIRKFNCRLSPLSTKPQALGLFNYWKRNKGDFSLIYCSPLGGKTLYEHSGLGKSHVLKQPS